MSIIRAKVPKLAWISALLVGFFFPPLRSSGGELNSKCHLIFRKSRGLYIINNL